MTDLLAADRYANPPIEEGLCQVAFSEPLDWGVASPGLLWTELRSTYPQPPVAQDQISAAVEIEGGESPGPSLSVNRGPQRFVFRDESGQKLVIGNAGLLSVNSLKPYEGWPSLRLRLRHALDVVWSVCGVRPVNKVTLRYINRVVIPGAQIDTDDYFNVAVRTAEGGLGTFTGFVHRVESVCTDGRTSVVSTFATIESEPGTNAFILDLEFSRQGMDLRDLDAILRQADEIKVLENAEFESMIKEPTRGLFA